MKRIGIVAALPAELKPLVEGWVQTHSRRGESAWQGSVNAVACVAVCCGMGKDAAERACALAEQDGPLDALISVGWAGALSCGMQPGEAYFLNEVVDAATGERFTTCSTPRGGNAGPLRIVTLDHVALPPEKKRLGETFQAVLVDMEAAAVARFALRRNAEFYCLKAVSDVAGERLPDFSGFTDDRGQLKFGSFLPWVSVRPQFWPGLGRVARNGKTGALAIATALKPVFQGVATGGKTAVFG